MAETKHQLEPTIFPVKCKPDLSSEDKPTKNSEAPKRNSSAPDDKDIKFEADSLAEAEDDSDGDYEDDDEDAENDHGEAEVDRKGKGMVRDDKGKGKLKVEEEDANDDESNLSDDPLAEVDLDNILPFKTQTNAISSEISTFPSSLSSVLFFVFNIFVMSVTVAWLGCM